MKPILSISSLCLCLLLGAGVASATFVDLSTFSTDPGVSVAGNTVTFTEGSLGAIFFFNDHFSVDPNATSLSFDYSLILGPGDKNYVAGIIYTDYFFIQDKDGNGSFQYDFFALRGSEISLAFGLLADNDDPLFPYGSIATISNVDLATSATPIPEPGTLILLGSGLAGLLGIGRKKVTGFFK